MSDPLSQVDPTSRPGSVIIKPEDDLPRWAARGSCPLGSVSDLIELLAGKTLAVLTGAGCSTESGIPDYRGPETRRRARNPIQYGAFVADAAARQRYWARSVVGWPRFRDVGPNDAHRALARLEASGVSRGLITQNVDRLHTKAGSRHVIELHGSLHDVRCRDCGAVEPRQSLQERLTQANPTFGVDGAEIAPDGDAELSQQVIDGFDVLPCQVCGGVLKPDVVFFGESVPRQRVTDAFALLHEADALLVAGSSLAVFSGYRFVRQAHKDGKPIAMVNLGPTRGDAEATLRVDEPVGSVLPRLVESLIAAST